MMNREDVVNKAKELVKPYGILVYLSKFGSKLYGTDTPESDEDYKGIYVPYQDMMILNTATHYVSYNTSDSNQKNTKDDIDIELKSIQTFLKELSRGDTGAFDLAFSYTNKDAVVYENKLYMRYFHNNIHKFFHPQNINTFIGFAYGQAKKYSVKGDKVVILDRIIEFLDANKDKFCDSRIKDFSENLLNFCGDKKYCYYTEDDCNKYIQVLNSKYVINNKYDYFLDCMTKARSAYGKRAESVSKAVMSGKPSADWKSLSHAYRCVCEAYELLTEEKITFPLSESKVVKDIKFGLIELDNVLSMIDDMVNSIDDIVKSGNVVDRYDVEFVNEFVMMLYRHYFNPKPYEF